MASLSGAESRRLKPRLGALTRHETRLRGLGPRCEAVTSQPTTAPLMVLTAAGRSLCRSSVFVARERPRLGFNRLLLSQIPYSI